MDQQQVRHWEAFTPPKYQKKLQLRFANTDVYRAMVELAKEHGRSLNNEIIQAIREYVERERMTP